MPSFRHQTSSLLLAGLVCILCITPAERCNAQNRAQQVTYVTRSEAAQFLLKRSNRVIPYIMNNGKYSDVIDGEPYARYVLYAAGIGMWSPDPATNRLHPHKPISRGEFLQMLAAVFNLPLNMAQNFEDVQGGDWDAPYTGIARKYGIFHDPRDAQRLRSELPVTHEEVSTNLSTLFAEQPDLRPVQHILIHKVVYEDTDSRRAQPEQPDRNMLYSYTTVTSRSQIRESLQQIKNLERSNADVIQDQIIIAVNKEREKAGLASLSVNMQLEATAEQHAKDMQARGYFSHFTPEGKSFVDRIKDSGYTDIDPIACGCTQVLTVPKGKEQRRETKPDYAVYSRDVCHCQPKFALGENLAQGQLTPEEVVRDWMRSEGHRQNILQPAFTEIGVGIFRDMWVQNFGNFELVLP